MKDLRPKQREPARQGAAPRQPEEAATRAAGLPAVVAAAPDHPTARARRQARARGVQRAVGNRAAQRLVQRGWLDDAIEAVSSVGSAVAETVSAAGSAVAETVGGWIDDVDTKSRGLSGDEIAAAQEIFGETIDYSQVVLERNSLYNAGSSRTVGNTIALTDDKFDGDGLTLNSAGRSTLIHELAHVWQYQNRGWSYAPEALWAQAKAWWETGSRNAAYDWEQLHADGVPWEEWNPEAQAEAVEDYNDALQRIKAGEGTADDYQTLKDAQPYIDKMRGPPPSLGETTEPSDGAEGGPPAYDEGAGGAGGTSPSPAPVYEGGGGAGSAGGTSAPQGLSPTVRYGSTGKGVRKLQQRLNAAGAEPPLKVDGIFGPKTRAAVVAFQEGHADAEGQPLEPDGIVGPKTWGAIERRAAEPTIAADEASLGEHVAEGITQNNEGPHEADRGVHYAHNYKASFPELWKDDFEYGYADPTYFERVGFMDWMLKPRMSASAAIKSWLRGLTIAECTSAIVAIEIDTLRAAIGDTKFDEQFGSTDRLIPREQRLRIKQGTAGTPVEQFMKQTEGAEAGDPGTIGHRPARPGEWYYFYNHPKYLLKHPGGAFQGENSIYLGEKDGEQHWSGMGLHDVTELEMLDEMVGAYNLARDEFDFQELARIKARNGGVLPPQYDPASGEFPEQIAGPDEVLSAPEYEIDGVKRKGGFVLRAGRVLDAEKVQQLRDE
ncbi:MAG TPA: peptidoglycan-binding protein [Chloroflexaceae bacterium]|nr:peptidoglycan-binding protein [Chloroflexaceae bacterium]